MPSTVALNIDLPSSKNAIANRADALVVERIPFLLPVGSFQNCESLFRRKVGLDRGQFNSSFPARSLTPLRLILLPKRKRWGCRM